MKSILRTGTALALVAAFGGQVMAQALVAAMGLTMTALGTVATARAWSSTRSTSYSSINPLLTPTEARLLTDETCAPAMLTSAAVISRLSSRTSSSER